MEAKKYVTKILITTTIVNQDSKCSVQPYRGTDFQSVFSLSLHVLPFLQCSASFRLECTKHALIQSSFGFLKGPRHSSLEMTLDVTQNFHDGGQGPGSKELIGIPLVERFNENKLSTLQQRFYMPTSEKIKIQVHGTRGE